MVNIIYLYIIESGKFIIVECFLMVTFIFLYELWMLKWSAIHNIVLKNIINIVRRVSLM